jgi:hypothetical protein
MRTTVRIIVAPVAALAVLSLAAPSAHAIPARARRYGTSCLTCHTVYPKLNPFGEAFRRNGYKFPGKDTDYVKMDTVPLGNDAYKAMFPHAVWPADLPASAPLAFGANGQAVFHPDTHSGAGTADNYSVFTLQDLVGEAHLWAGGALTEHVSYFAEVTFSSDHTIDLEHAELHFNDLVVRSPHVLNIYVGRGSPNLTSFGPHSSYVADTNLPGLMTTALLGATSDSFAVNNQDNLVEVNGMFHGRLIYSLGIDAGSNLDVRNTENVYAHLGGKIGGLRLDGEGGAAGDPNKPWAEKALTFDAFGYRSVSHFTPAAGPLTPPGETPSPFDDTTWVVGGQVRGQLGSLELNAGAYYEWHDHATADGTSAEALAQWDEISYIIFPWLVPAVRLEWANLRVPGTDAINDLKIIPGVAALVLPNLKLTLTGQIEWADGTPPGGWMPFGGSAAPPTGAVTEIETINLGLAYAF